MFQNDELKNHLETTSTIRSQPAVFAEWNMNIATNISLIGNYRYRPADGPSSTFGNAVSSFDPSDAGGFYTGATDADVVVDGGLDDDDQPLAFISKKEKESLLYSLEDCFGKFRPRSGINKLRYFETGFSHHTNINMSRRPRYYMAHKDDAFKYWSSYRTENGIERGIASRPLNGQHYIDDACPFVVYKNAIPSNRIVVKMQTNVGEVDLGPFNSSTGSFPDPFFGEANKTTPVKWKVQVLKSNNWIDVVSFNSSSTRRDGSPIVGSDGYVELSYGLRVPEKYRDIFIKAEEYFTESFLPEKSVNGYAYLIKNNDSDIGTYHIWLDSADDYETFVPDYGWYLEDGQVDRLTNFVTDLTSPIVFTDSLTGTSKYREFEEISGIRVVVDTMNKVNSIFDLIEISPRLAVNLTEKLESFDIKKSASDLGQSGMPVGQLLAGVGSATLFDYDQAFSSINSQSIVSKYLSTNIQFKFFEVIVDVNGFDYFVPIKTMYSEAMPDQSSKDRSVKIELRDLFFYFESQGAPQIMVQNASVSYAVSLLLDSIGFSNYVFKRAANESESIIPVFFIPPDKSIAEILNDIAVSTQTAIFFDEYNNLVLMSKEYMLPAPGVRNTDITLYGTQDFEVDGAISNKTNSAKIANIIDISSKQDSVFNDGSISYTTRSIKRRLSSLEQVDRNSLGQTFAYEAALLWESTSTGATRSLNQNNEDYTLSAIPLNSDLSDSLPVVRNGVIENNIIELGEGVDWMTRYNGYFYANGEIIKYDALEFDIPGSDVLRLERTRDGRIVSESSTTGKIGKVWITSQREYDRYFSKISFNGKMYGTGRVRIYTEPNYVIVNGVEKLADGPVAKHGRGQFGTKVVYHSAGLNPYWSNNDNVRGFFMDSSSLFGAPRPTTTPSPAPTPTPTPTPTGTTGSEPPVLEPELGPLESVLLSVEPSSLSSDKDLMVRFKLGRFQSGYIGFKNVATGAVSWNPLVFQTASLSIQDGRTIGSSPPGNFYGTGGIIAINCSASPGQTYEAYIELFATKDYSGSSLVSNTVTFTVPNCSSSTTTPTPSPSPTPTPTPRPNLAYATFCSNGNAVSVGNGLGFSSCLDLQEFINANYVNVTNFECRVGSIPPLPSCTPAPTPTPTPSPTPTPTPTLPEGVE